MSHRAITRGRVEPSDNLKKIHAVQFGRRHEYLDVIGKGTGASKTITTIIGSTTLGESFGVGDEIYLHWVRNIDADLSKDMTLHFHWGPDSVEVGKLVSWEVTVLLMSLGKDLSADDLVATIVDDLYPSVQYADTSTSEVVIPAALFTNAVASLHVKLKRIASSNDPTGRPIVHHGQVTFHYDLSRTG